MVYKLQHQKYSNQFIKILLLIIFYSETISSSRSKFQEQQANQCDLEVKNNICLFNGDQVLSSKSIDDDLIGHWNFNEETIFDQTSYKSQTIYKNIEVYPGMTGYGNSGGFRKNSHMLIKSKYSLETENSIQFQFYLQDLQYFQKTGEDYSNVQFTIFEKFEQQGQESKLNIKMSVMAKSRKIRVVYAVQQDKKGKYEQHEFTSQSSILFSKWTHITLVREENVLQLWINGYQDISLSPKFPLYFGEEKNHQILFGDLASNSQYTQTDYMNFQIDNIKIYKRCLKYHEIQAEAEIFLGGLSPQQYSLGCQNCKAQDIKCDLENYHYCTSFELLSGGYQVARNMGWMENNIQLVWSLEGIQQNLKNKEDILGLGLCCKNMDN